jgi:hypothetical protein
MRDTTARRYFLASMSDFVHVVEVLAAGLGGSLLGGYTQRHIARSQIAADNAKIRAAAYGDFLRLATPQRIERSLAAAGFNAAGQPVEDQDEVVRWRRELDAASANLLVLAPAEVRHMLDAFLLVLASEEARISAGVFEDVNEGLGDWLAVQHARENVLERRWESDRSALVDAIRADVAA